ncbi:MAG: FKBP-type peptidyl-prolyl cis-trans isomerase SlpA [Gammaproteobacteria bacterium]|jgi:FKBP-type peptidyl-prolyl cis-trans isomerase SlpA
MSMINQNSVVTLHYQLGLTDDHLLEDNFDEDPMTVTLGREEMAKGLEFALLGLRKGDVQTIDIPPDLAFGFPDETLLRALPRDDFDETLELEEGLIIEFTTEDGEVLPGTITGFDDNEVRVDLNHPLAGDIVRYKVKILEVVNNIDNESCN